MKLRGWIIAGVVVIALLIVILTNQRIFRSTGRTIPPPTEAVPTPAGRTLLEFDIHQDMELIIPTPFGEPPQFAVWLEDPVSHRLQTIFVTYRSATGDLVGKVECPACLPRWFEVYEQETGGAGLPTQDSPAPAAVTCATPQEESFKLTYEVEPGSRWICWLEMNLAGDFNEKYKEYDEEAKTFDWDYDGQPSLIYRCEITAIPGQQIVPELYGKTVLNAPSGETVQPVTDDITTARAVFNSIKISVVSPEQYSPK